MQRILLVEDHPKVARSLADMVERLGHQVTIAGGGAEGIDAFRAAQAGADPFALVITDFSMEGLNGLAVAAAVKGDSPSTPVVLMTAYRIDAEDPLPPHVDAVVSKPPATPELRELIARLSRHRA